MGDQKIDQQDPKLPKYDKCNIFVGAYRVPRDGHVRLGSCKVRILHGIVDENGWRESVLGGPWLIIEDGGFWPVMIKLNAENIKSMLMGLQVLESQ